MRFLATIFALILGSCSSSQVIQFKLYLGDSSVVGKWSQVSGPGQLTFSTTNDSVVNIRADKPKRGTYIIQAINNNKIATATINVSK
jgi:hypothetical protein